MQKTGRESSSAPLPPNSGPRLRRAMLARLVGIQLTTAMVILGIPAITPALREEFTLSRAGAGLLMTAAFLGVVAGSWPAGRAVNAIGVGRPMVGAPGGLGLFPGGL